MSQPVKVVPKIRLKDFDPDYTGEFDKEKAREATIPLCLRISELQERLYADARHAVLILLQGMDTSGKDGAAKRVLEFVVPSGIETANFKAPSDEELSHDFLWRVHKVVPRYGNIGIFNRSHYEDVIAVRVLKLAPKSVWKARYEQINAFEKHLSENGILLLKFFLHISKEEQATRLQARLDDPTKNWKFRKDDLKMREHWKKFREAYEDAINHCSTKLAPWHIVPSNHKWYRDYVIARTVVDAMGKLNLKWPKPKEDLSKIRIA
jgi:PPK2 family polyphosphate:nucleotide phosphotransferase